MSDFSLDLNPNSSRRKPPPKAKPSPEQEAHLSNLLRRIRWLEESSEVYAEMCAAAEAKVRARVT